MIYNDKTVFCSSLCFFYKLLRERDHVFFAPEQRIDTEKGENTHTRIKRVEQKRATKYKKSLKAYIDHVLRCVAHFKKRATRFLRNRLFIVIDHVLRYVALFFIMSYIMSYTPKPKNDVH